MHYKHIWVFPEQYWFANWHVCYLPSSIYSFPIEMLKLMENSPTSALPPGCTGNISITVIAHLGRNGWAWLLTTSHNLITLSFGSKWVLGIQFCHPVSVRCGSTPLVWVLFVWFCCYCSVFSVLWVLFLLLAAFSPPHPLPFLNYPTPWPFLCLDFPILVSVQSVPYFCSGCSF